MTVQSPSQPISRAPPTLPCQVTIQGRNFTIHHLNGDGTLGDALTGLNESSLREIQKLFTETIKDPLPDNIELITREGFKTKGTEQFTPFIAIATLFDGLMKIIQCASPSLGDRKRIFDSLYELATYAAKQRPGYKALSKKEQQNVVNGIMRSCKESSDVKKERVTYKMQHNSPFKGWQYRNGDEIITVPDHCVSSSLDRLTPALTCARVMQLDERDICYAGRPDTPEKFIELVTMMIKSKYPNPDNYPTTFNFVINSFISTLSKKDLQLSGETTEYKLLADELAMLADAPKEITIDGKTIKLNCKIFCGNFNFMNNLEKVLPASISGKLRGRLISDSVSDLEALIPQDQERSPLLSSALTRLKGDLDTLTAEEELFLRLIVCKEAGIPIVLHCRSCVDRTSIAAAMLYAIHLYGEIPTDNPLSVLDEPKFKACFWEHIKIAHTVSSYSREEYGFKWQTTPFKWFTQHPAALRLLPDEVLTTFNFWNLSIKEQLLMWSPVKIKMKNRKPKVKFNPYAPMAPFFTLVSGLRHIRDLFLISTPLGQKIVDVAKLLYIVPLTVLSLIPVILLMSIVFIVGTIFGIYLQIKSAVFLKKPTEQSDKKYTRKEWQTKITTAQDQSLWYFPVLLGAKAAILPFFMIPEKMIKPGTEGVKGEPLMFGDKVAKPKESV